MQSHAADILTDPATSRCGPRGSVPNASRSRGTSGEIGFSKAPNSHGFVTMLSDYHASGGLARADNLGRLLDDWQCGGFVSLAKLIAAGDIFSFRWQGESWVPMFQFELRDLSVKPGPRLVLAELKPVLDDWGLAVWFIQPNPRLKTRRPLDLLDSDTEGVLVAARAERSIAGGPSTF
jgi:hypothetical protein